MYRQNIEIIYNCVWNKQTYFYCSLKGLIVSVLFQSTCVCMYCTHHSNVTVYMYDSFVCTIFIQLFVSYSKVHVYTCTVLTIPMWLSICMILLFAPYSYNFERTSFSTPNTTPSFPLMPTIVLWRNTEQSIYFLWVLLFQSLLLHTSHASQSRFLKVTYIFSDISSQRDD